MSFLMEPGNSLTIEGTEEAGVSLRQTACRCLFRYQRVLPKDPASPDLRAGQLVHVLNRDASAVFIEVSGERHSRGTTKASHTPGPKYFYCLYTAGDPSVEVCSAHQAPR
jgi:hypothetical protein